jgi:anti-sigma-K factor RskA
VILLGVSTVYNYSLYTKNKEQETALAAKNNLPTTLPAADFSVLKNPGITPVAMYGVGIHAICRCTMFWDKKTGKAYVMIHHLVKSGDKRDYQLWAMVDGKPVNVGLVNDEIRDRFIEVTNVPANATAFSVTLENAGGSNTPTVEETYLEGKLI